VEVGPPHLLGVRQKSGVAVVAWHAASGLSQLWRRCDDDDLVEPRVGTNLVEERHLGDAHGRRIVELRELVPPLQVLARDEGVQQAFQPREGLGVTENGMSDRRPIRTPVLAEDARPQSRDKRFADDVVGGEEVMDDLVARDSRRAVGAECL
jgi:hypothetical protein